MESRERAGSERSEKRTGEITEMEMKRQRQKESTKRERKRELEIEQRDHTIGNVVRACLRCDGALCDASQLGPT